MPVNHGSVFFFHCVRMAAGDLFDIGGKAANFWMRVRMGLDLAPDRNAVNGSPNCTRPPLTLLDGAWPSTSPLPSLLCRPPSLVSSSRQKPSPPAHGAHLGPLSRAKINILLLLQGRGPEAEGHP